MSRDNYVRLAGTASTQAPPIAHSDKIKRPRPHQSEPIHVRGNYPSENAFFRLRAFRSNRFITRGLSRIQYPC